MHPIRSQSSVLDELAEVLLDLVDALRQGPILVSLALLLALLLVVGLTPR